VPGGNFSALRRRATSGTPRTPFALKTQAGSQDRETTKKKKKSPEPSKGTGSNAQVSRLKQVGRTLERNERQPNHTRFYGESSHRGATKRGSFVSVTKDLAV